MVHKDVAQCGAVSPVLYLYWPLFSLQCTSKLGLLAGSLMLISIFVSLSSITDMSSDHTYLTG